MLTLIRRVFGRAKSEHVLQVGLRRSRTRFFGYLVVDAAFTVALVTMGFHFYGPVAWAGHEGFMLEHPKVIPAPLDSILDYVTRENEKIFWIGSHAGNLYTLEPSFNGEQTVSYFSATPSDASGSTLLITVSTFQNSLVYKEKSHLTLGSSAVKIVVAGGKSIEFEKVSPMSQIVTFADNAEVVTIEYSTSQTLGTLSADAEKLRLLT